MILRRLTANLKAQNWTAISIEFLIVVVGVFIGTQVSNWNQARIEKRETERLVEQMRPEIADKLEFFKSAKIYYATTRRFAEQALGGWKYDPRISDAQFVIAAYQASQIYGIGINPQSWSVTFGGDQLRNIDDPDLRRTLMVVLTSDYDPVAFNAVATPYREHVRRIIPKAVQDQIRAHCGDLITSRGSSQYITALPPTCSLKLDPAAAREAAAALRAHPELVGELNWHLASVATYLSNAEGLEGGMRTLDQELEKRT
jgi:hypothetical protein